MDCLRWGDGRGTWRRYNLAEVVAPNGIVSRVDDTVAVGVGGPFVRRAKRVFPQYVIGWRHAAVAVEVAGERRQQGRQGEQGAMLLNPSPIQQIPIVVIRIAVEIEVSEARRELRRSALANAGPSRRQSRAHR